METDGHGIDKRLSRIDRWLRRCMAACRCGSWNSALMEIECMEAEARECREELWGIAADEARGRVRRPLRASVFLGARAAVLALIMIMALGFPLSVDQDLPFEGFSSYGESVAVLSITESDILNALRESLSSQNTGRVILTLDRTQTAETESLPPQPGAAAADEKPPRAETDSRAGIAPGRAAARSAGEPRSGDMKGLAAERRTPVPAEIAAQAVKAEKAGKVDKEPSLEEVISLIQVGQRALRTSEPAVQVVSP